MNLEPLKTFIRKLEARGSYDIVWGGIPANARPAHKLTEMTVGEVLDWQRTIRKKGYGSTACGGYQFIYKTLLALVTESKTPLSAKFDARLQDRFAIRLMEGRGLGKYVNGTISTEAFCNELAKEWASLPLVSGPKKGRSFYANDGLNKALTDVGPFIDAVSAIKASLPRVKDIALTVPGQDRPNVNPVAYFINLIGAALKMLFASMRK
jgi:hypothetical protein